jgi:hypothetical protein
VQAGIDAGSMMYDPIAASMQILQDPDAMAQITEMMRDPRFQEEVRQAMNTNPMVAGLPQEIIDQMDPQVVVEQMEAMMQDPEFMAKAKRAAKEMEQIMQDPAFLEQANRMAQQMAQQQRRSNALTTLLLALNPAAARVGSVAAPAFARSPARQLKMEESDDAVAKGAAAVGALLGVVLTGGLTGAAVLGAGAAYATNFDNGVGSAAKTAGGFAAKAYDKTVEINEQYDVIPKVKKAADTVLTVADNLNKNYGLTDKVDEKLKLSATFGKALDKIEETKDSLTSKVDDLKKSATESEK